MKPERIEELAETAFHLASPAHKWEVSHESWKDRYRDIARTLYAEVLEEAAKVAENAFTQECCGLGVGSPMECCADPICVALAPHEIAEAIRAMKGDAT